MDASAPIILLLIIVAAVIFFYIRKKKKNNASTGFVSQRKEKDEVWKTIKKFLKDNENYGHELVESYVVKKNSIDYINPKESSFNKKKLRYEEKIRRFINDTKHKQVEKYRDLYLVFFKTKNNKTNELNKPRCIECEVVSKKINKKETDRQILILGEKNYDKEMLWVAPIKEGEELKNYKTPKQIAKEKKLELKIEMKKKKMVEKAKNKINKKS